MWPVVFGIFPDVPKHEIPNVHGLWNRVHPELKLTRFRHAYKNGFLLRNNLFPGLLILKRFFERIINVPQIFMFLFDDNAYEV